MADLNLLHLYFAPPLGVNPLEFRRDVVLASENCSPWTIVWRSFRDPTFSRFCAIPACDRQTDRQTDTWRQHVPR